jgi:hypothetical protein
MAKVPKLAPAGLMAARLYDIESTTTSGNPRAVFWTDQKVIAFLSASS